MHNNHVFSAIPPHFVASKHYIQVTFKPKEDILELLITCVFD